MATVKVSLGLNSNNVLSSPLALSVSSSIIADSGSLIKAKVKGTAADTNDMIVYLANDKSERAYLYVRNLETRLEDYLFLRNERHCLYRQDRWWGVCVHPAFTRQNIRSPGDQA